MDPGTAAAITVGTSVLGLGLSAYQTFAKPSIKIPVVRIPEEDLARINSAIEANKALSDQARATINQNIAMYNEGKLSPQYQAKLDEWWAQASKNLSQRLASAGLENSSVAQSAYNELARQYASLSADMLRQQLSDALSLTGLTQEYINELLSKTQLELGAQSAYAQAYAQAMPLAQLASAQKGTASAGLTEAGIKVGEELPSVLEKLGVTTKKTVTGTEPLYESTLKTALEYASPY